MPHALRVLVARESATMMMALVKKTEMHYVRTSGWLPLGIISAPEKIVIGQSSLPPCALGIFVPY